MGTDHFAGAVTVTQEPVSPETHKADMVRGARRILETGAFGILDGFFDEHLALWKSTQDSTARVVCGLGADSSTDDWRNTAVAVATLFARAPKNLGARLGATDLYESLWQKADSTENGQAIIDFMNHCIEEFQHSQTAEHVSAFDREM